MSSVSSRIEGGVLELTLNRPEKRNALDRPTIEALTEALKACAADDKVRVVKITGAGGIFCAGADLTEMQAQAHATEQENLAHASKLSGLLGLLYQLPKPTLARVNGDGYGGALGLIAACDVVVAVDRAKFAFTEVRLGIVPAVISPFVVGKMGEAKALRYFLTADTLSAADLKLAGLAHEVVGEEALDLTCKLIEQSFLKGAPGALGAAKALIRDVAQRPPLERAQASLEMAARLAQMRVKPEAQEGFKAFFEKRKPGWRLD